MMGESVRLAVECQARRMRVENPFFVAASEGKVTPRAAARYVENLRYAFALTPVCLSRARAVAAARGLHELADFFERKLAEEAGHDAWAVDDLQRLGEAKGADCEGYSVSAFSELATLLLELIDRDPRLYLVYIFFAEYVTVLLGSELLEQLQSRCGIPRDLLTSLGRHVELDAHHADEGIEALDCYLDDPSLLPSARALVSCFAESYEDVMREVLAEDATYQAAS